MSSAFQVCKNLKLVAIITAVVLFVFTACSENGIFNPNEHSIPYTGEVVNLVPNQSITGKWGYIDPTTDEQVIPCRYDTAHYFCEGLAAVKLNGNYGYIDQDGNTLIQHRFCHANNFTNSLAQVGLNSRYCYIDRDGNIINQNGNGTCNGRNHRNGGNNSCCHN